MAEDRVCAMYRGRLAMIDKILAIGSGEDSLLTEARAAEAQMRAHKCAAMKSAP